MKRLKIIIIAIITLTIIGCNILPDDIEKGELIAISFFAAFIITSSLNVLVLIIERFFFILMIPLLLLLLVSCSQTGSNESNETSQQKYQLKPFNKGLSDKEVEKLFKVYRKGDHIKISSTDTVFKGEKILYVAIKFSDENISVIDAKGKQFNIKKKIGKKYQFFLRTEKNRYVSRIVTIKPGRSIKKSYQTYLYMDVDSNYHRLNIKTFPEVRIYSYIGDEKIDISIENEKYFLKQIGYNEKSLKMNMGLWKLKTKISLKDFWLVKDGIRFSNGQIAIPFDSLNTFMIVFNGKLPYGKIMSKVSPGSNNQISPKSLKGCYGVYYRRFSKMMNKEHVFMQTYELSKELAFQTEKIREDGNFYVKLNFYDHEWDGPRLIMYPIVNFTIRTEPFQYNTFEELPTIKLQENIFSLEKVSIN